MPPSAGAPGRGDSKTERRGESVPKHRHLRKLATSWWRLAVALAVLAATFAAGTAALAGPASRDAPSRDAASRPAAIGQKAAIQAALSALGVARRSDAEIVFGLARPIAAHTAVTLGGPAGPAVSGLATGTGAAVTLRPTHAAWLFYDDRGPFQAYEHPGRVALVDTVTGRVTMSGTMLWPPVVGGALPPFLHSADAYAAASGHVFYRPYRGSARLAAAAPRGRRCPGSVRPDAGTSRRRRTRGRTRLRDLVRRHPRRRLLRPHADRSVPRRARRTCRAAESGRARGAIGDLRSAGARDAGIARAQRSLSPRLP